MAFPNNMFIYKVEASSDNNISMYGYMDVNFMKLSDPISITPNPFSMGLSLIETEEESYCIDVDFNKAIELSSSYFLLENAILRVSTDYISPEISVVAIIDNPETYLVPAKVDTGSFSNSGEIFKYGFKTLSDFLAKDSSKDISFAVEPKFEDARPFIRGLAAVKSGGKWGFIDKDGNFIIDCIYLNVHDFTEPAAFVFLGEDIQVKDSTGNQSLKKEGSWGLIDIGGVPLTEFNIRYADTFHEGWSAVYLNNESNYINIDGKQLLEENIEGLVLMEPFRSGIAAIHDSFNGTHSFYDSNGVLLLKLDLNNTPTFSNGLAAIKKRSHYTYIDMTGKTVIDGEYLTASDFSNGYAFVIEEFGESGFIIDKLGNKYLEDLNIDGMTLFNDDGYALAYSIINKNQSLPIKLFYMVHIEDY
jgi:hypothetical protein